MTKIGSEKWLPYGLHTLGTTQKEAPKDTSRVKLSTHLYTRQKHELRAGAGTRRATGGMSGREVSIKRGADYSRRKQRDGG